MTVSHLTRRFSLATVGVALVALAAGCADVGSGSSAGETEFPVVKSTDHDVIVCQSIRTAIQRDKKAAADAQAAGRTAEAKSKEASVLVGVEGAKSVKNCDVSDLVPAAAGASPSPS